MRVRAASVYRYNLRLFGSGIELSLMNSTAIHAKQNMQCGKNATHLRGLSQARFENEQVWIEKNREIRLEPMRHAVATLEPAELSDVGEKSTAVNFLLAALIYASG